MSKVSEVLSVKGNKVISTESSTTIYEAIKKISDANVGSILVMEKGNFVGLFSERDFLKKCGVGGIDPKTAKVKEIMTSNIICVDPDSSVEECMAIMTEKRIRHLPVMKGKDLVGIISIGDLVKFISKIQEIKIEYLTDYISGKYPG